MKILIYDATDDKFVGLTWKIGAFLFAPLFDKVIKAYSWPQALKELDNFIGNGSKAYEVQFWGHGIPGSPLINKTRMPLRDRRIFSSTKRWWFRCCSVLAEKEGHSLATWFSFKNVEIVGHTSIIGGLGMHPFLFGLKPGQNIYWDEKEQDWKKLTSRTISAFRMSIPSWTFDQKK